MQYVPKSVTLPKPFRTPTFNARASVFFSNADSGNASFSSGPRSPFSATYPILIKSSDVSLSDSWPLLLKSTALMYSMSQKCVTLTISEINFGTFSIAQILLILGLNTCEFYVNSLMHRSICALERVPKFI